jgi:hypothetical protein
MNEREFKNHLADLAKGKHHPEEHDWTGGEKPQADDRPAARKPPKRAVKATRRRK